jgi:hypothetical protein
MTLVRADFDLVGYAQDTATLWFAGLPQPDRLLVSGVPGHPVLGLAQFTDHP